MSPRPRLRISRRRAESIPHFGYNDIDEGSSARKRAMTYPP